MSLAKMLSRALFMSMALCAGETAPGRSAAAMAVAGGGAGVTVGAFGAFGVCAARTGAGAGASFCFFSFFTLGTTMSSRSMAMWTGFLEIFTLSNDLVSS